MSIKIKTEPKNETEFNLEFIKIFQSLPELWDPNNIQYTNKAARLEYLTQLLQIYKKHKPDATIHDVKSKINNLRSNYRRDLHKMLKLKKVGKTWRSNSGTFHALRFLDGIDDTTSTMSRRLKKRTKRFQPNEIRQLLSEHPQMPEGPISSQHTDCNNLEPIVLTWSRKLKGLTVLRRLIVEKTITDILFSAEIEQLSESNSINTCLPNLPTSTISISETSSHSELNPLDYPDDDDEISPSAVVEVKHD